MSGLQASLPASQVLVTIGQGYQVGALGRNEAYRARQVGDPNWVGFAAADARFVDVVPESDVDHPLFRVRGDGSPISVEEIEARWGVSLRERSGVRFLPADYPRNPSLPEGADIGAPLAFDLERGSQPGGLRELAGLTEAALRRTPAFMLASKLFSDDPSLGPAVQAQLFLITSLMALAALPRPLVELVAAHRFRVAAASAYGGQDAYGAMGIVHANDPLCHRLASYLSTHGPGLLMNLLAPAASPLAVLKDPTLIDGLRSAGDRMLLEVPQAPLLVQAACASASTVFDSVAKDMLLRYPGVSNPEVVLWTAADAALCGDARLLEGFGKALITRKHLAESGRPVAECIATFDKDGTGLCIEDYGAALVVTTLEFAVAHQLPISTIVAGWGQSAETGGKYHAAGAGWGIENAITLAYRMAHQGHGLDVDYFAHLVAHATGSKITALSDLQRVSDARRWAAESQGLTGDRRRMTVGAPKSTSGHPQGPSGLKAALEAIQYVSGRPTIGIPTLRSILPELAQLAADEFLLQAEPLPGSQEAGALAAVQGFSGYCAAMLFAPATLAALRRYRFEDERARDAYLEAMPEIRAAARAREARWARTDGAALQLALQNRWPSAEERKQRSGV